MKSTVTNYMMNCIVCGVPNIEVHHLVYGKGRRNLADDDKLILPLCAKHHKELHDNGTAGVLSKIVGQMAYERDRCTEGMTQEEARESFRKRYGSSYV